MKVFLFALLFVFAFCQNRQLQQETSLVTYIVAIKSAVNQKYLTASNMGAANVKASGALVRT